MIRRAGMQPLRSLSIGLIVAAASLSIAAPCRAQDVSVSLRADQQQPEEAERRGHDVQLVHAASSGALAPVRATASRL